MPPTDVHHAYASSDAELQDRLAEAKQRFEHDDTAGRATLIHVHEANSDDCTDKCTTYPKAQR